jgi:transcriptional regulator
MTSDHHQASQVVPADPASPFERASPGQIRLLVDSCPLAWVIAGGGEEASLLPLIGVYDQHGRLVELIGHFARSNPLHAALLDDPRALILFTGPQGYISPALAGRRDWGPTWNYAQLQIRAEISVEPELTPAAIELLAGRLEQDQADPWRPAELGPRYGQLMTHIVAFRARVTRVRPRFKLGQDEAPDILQTILSGLPDPELARWMRLFNAGRLAEPELPA